MFSEVEGAMDVEFPCRISIQKFKKHPLHRSLSILRNVYDIQSPQEMQTFQTNAPFLNIDRKGTNLIQFVGTIGKNFMTDHKIT